MWICNKTKWVTWNKAWLELMKESHELLTKQYKIHELLPEERKRHELVTEGISTVVV